MNTTESGVNIWSILEKESQAELFPLGLPDFVLLLSKELPEYAFFMDATTSDSRG